VKLKEALQKERESRKSFEESSTKFEVCYTKRILFLLSQAGEGGGDLTVDLVSLLLVRKQLFIVVHMNFEKG